MSSTSPSSAASASPAGASSASDWPRVVEQGWRFYGAFGDASGRKPPQDSGWLVEPPVSAGLLAGGAVMLDSIAMLLPAGLAILRPGGAVAGHGAVRMTVIIVLTALVVTIVAGGVRGAYKRAGYFRPGHQLRALLPAAALAWIAALGVAAAFGVPLDADFGTLVTVAMSGIGLLVVGRIGVARLAAGRLGDRLTPRAVILGDGPAAATLATAIRGDRGSRLRLRGTLGMAPTHRPELPYLGTPEQVFEMIQYGQVDRILLASPVTGEYWSSILRRLSEHSVEVEMVHENQFSIEGPELITVVSPRIGGWRAILKSAEDYAIAIVALAIVAVPMAIIAVAIRLDSPGPILFRQRRIGLNNRPFEILKFRTLHHAAADHGVSQQVRTGDRRVSRVGAILRQTSLDELPQIFCVLRGDMSLVGPRPHAQGTCAGGKLFEDVVPYYAARHRVKPGMTGLAQVRGWRGATETEEKLIRRVDSDLEYIRSWSIWLDLAIVARSTVAVLRMRNAH